MLRHKELPSQGRLIECFEYSPDTGSLTWKHRPENRMFRWGGKPALAYINSQGYKIGNWREAGGGVKAHRVIWKIMTGEDANIIDHINGNRGDNRFSNLRSVDEIENARNLGLSKNNTSGFNGVYWFPNYGKWMVSIRINGARKTLGYFAKKEDAIAARAAADKEAGYTVRRV